MRYEIYTETNRVVCTETRLRADIHRETNIGYKYANRVTHLRHIYIYIYIYIYI